MVSLPEITEYMPGMDWTEYFQTELQKVATPAQKASAEAYFKGAVPFIGATGPKVDAVFKAAIPPLKLCSEAERFTAGKALLGEEYFELRNLGIMVLNRDVKKLPQNWFESLEPVVEQRCTNWGTADNFSGRVLRHRLPIEADRKRLMAWASDTNPWKRRMTCVAFVNEAKKGIYSEEIWIAAHGALALDHRFSQLGAGWLLRERWLAAPEEVETFLKANKGKMRREALRYAIEKMPKNKQLELLK
jgi:3-methyladenine DNA glycosylase AlkD